MAKIKLIAPVQDVRGTLGNLCYSNWKGRSYTRNLALSVSNPNSLFQERVRKCIEDLSKLWTGTLTDAQRAEWEEYAQQRGSAANQNTVVQRGSLIKPLGKILGGKNAYIGCNVWRYKHVLAAINDAPLGILPPSEPRDFSVVFTPGETPKFTATWADPGNLEDGGSVEVWGACGKVFHVQERDSVVKGVQTLDIETMRGAGGVTMDLVVGLYRFQTAAIDAHGQRGPGSNIITINVTALTA